MMDLSSVEYTQRTKPVKLLFVNPPIYDFTAFDFWLRPYGLLRVAGQLRGCACETFDYLVSHGHDSFGRGRFDQQTFRKPAALADVPRRFYRFGRPREDFIRLLSSRTFDVVLVQTVMTYWYIGVREVIEDVRRLQPHARIVLGGVYATLCPSHAQSLGADQVVEGSELAPLGLPLSEGLPLWESLNSEVGVIKITEGCPFRCTYCSVPVVYPRFVARPLDSCVEEVQHLYRLGCRNIAFYDDALLFKPESILLPFLEALQRQGLNISLHSPNALNARFITPPIARSMVRAGFKTFFLGLESTDFEWQRQTGGKVYADEFQHAVSALLEAGASAITAYIIIGHPQSQEQDLEGSIRFAAAAGARVMLSEFAPIPGTPDGEACRAHTDLDEPLNHNKTAFTLRTLGTERVAALKALCRGVNSSPCAASRRVEWKAIDAVGEGDRV
jgi:pyruvate-formate lyase-activating enzyme